MSGDGGRLSPSLRLADAAASVPVARDAQFFPDSKWEAVLAADDRIPDLSSSEVVRCMGMMLRRQAHFEEERRKERLIIEELVKDNRALKRKVEQVDSAMRESAKGALYCAAAPKYDASPLWSPRAMSIPEATWLQETLETLKPDDARLREVQKITATLPYNGVVTIDLKILEPRQQWQLYYYLKHDKVHKRQNVQPRGKKVIDAIDAGHSHTHVQIASAQNDNAWVEQEGHNSFNWDMDDGLD